MMRFDSSLTASTVISDRSGQSLVVQRLERQRARLGGRRTRDRCRVAVGGRRGGVDVRVVRCVVVVQVGWPCCTWQRCGGRGSGVGVVVNLALFALVGVGVGVWWSERGLRSAFALFRREGGLAEGVEVHGQWLWAMQGEEVQGKVRQARGRVVEGSARSCEGPTRSPSRSSARLPAHKVRPSVPPSLPPSLHSCSSPLRPPTRCRSYAPRSPSGAPPVSPLSGSRSPPL